MTTIGKLVIVAGVLMADAAPALANGPAYYFDIDGATGGFGLPGGTYTENGNNWSTDPAGASAGAALPSGAQMTFGYEGTVGITNTAFTINMDGNAWAGLAINVPCAVTLVGTANAYLTAAQTWTVPAGATLSESITWGSGGLNVNGQSINLLGDGTINFTSGIGYNSGATITENGTGMVVNLSGAAVGNQGADKQASYTLTNGMLNFASAAAANAFNRMRSADSARFSLNGGTVNNTSGSALTLDLYQGTYAIGGSFTFAGSSSLDLGTNVVVMTMSPTITVNSNMLTVGGVISGSFGFTKAGAGTLRLAASNTCSGPVAISGGTLALAGAGSIDGCTNITIRAGGVLDVTGRAAYTMASNTVYTFGLTNALSGQINAGALDISSAGVFFSGTTSNMVCILGSYTSLTGAGFASTNGLPARFTIEYNYKGLKQIALKPPVLGTVIRIR